MLKSLQRLLYQGQASTGHTRNVLASHRYCSVLLCGAGEDVHAGIARRYGVPMMSVRDTLHDLMWDDAGESSIAAL